MRQVRMYVDGYNFYYAIKGKYHVDRIKLGQESLIGLGWCDFRRLGEHMIDRDAEQITDIKYFTARVEQDYPGYPGERQRQQDWLNAVSTIPGLRKIMGHFLPPTPSQNRAADRSVKNPAGLKPFRKEQHTDINIAIEILLDALDAKGYHKAILISGDTDFAPAIYAVQKGMVDRGLLRNGKTVDVWVPGIHTNGWHAYFREPEHSCSIRIERITESMLAKSLLPYEKPRVYTCPKDWRLPGAYLKEKVPDGLRPDIARPESSDGTSLERKQ
jgi:uncharacterized LabA/DUF88 family protein